MTTRYSGRWLVTAAIGVSVALGLGATISGAMAWADLRVYDQMLRVAGGGTQSGRIGIVVIDNQSIERFGQWPWPRDLVGKLVDGLHTLGSAVIALDMMFPEREGQPSRPLTALPPGDLALVEAVSRGRVVLGHALTFDRASSGQNCVLHPLTLTLVEREEPATSALFRATGCVANLAELGRAATSSGFLNVGVDSDGTLRRLPMVMGLQDRVYPSFALAAVLASMGPTQVALASLSPRPLELHTSGRRIPLDARGTLALRFLPSSRRADYITAADVLEGKVAAGTFKNQIVFVGATAFGIEDVISTPLDRQYPGIEVHATMAENLLQGQFIVQLANRHVYEMATGVLLALLAPFLLVRLGSVRGALTLLGLLALCWVGSLLSLRQAGVFVSALIPTLAIGTGLVGWVAASAYRQRSLAASAQSYARHTAQSVFDMLVSLTQIRDPGTGRHAWRTKGYTRLLAERLRHSPTQEFRDFLTEDRINVLAALAPLHDIGKVGIRDAVLKKPGPLDPDELAEMRKHPSYGFETIAKTEQGASAHLVNHEMLQLAKDIVYTHHERWDGTGYPQGLSGRDIPIAGRIVAVVDVYDALVETRPYRPKLHHDEAVELIVLGRGSQFDPEVVGAFLEVSSEFLALRSQIGEDVGQPTTPDLR